MLGRRAGTCRGLFQATNPQTIPFSYPSSLALQVPGLKGIWNNSHYVQLDSPALALGMGVFVSLHFAPFLY